MTLPDMDIQLGTYLGSVAFQAFMALVAWIVLRREQVGLRMVGAAIAFVFPFIAIFGLLLYPRLRSRVVAATQSTQATGATQPQPVGIGVEQLLRDARERMARTSAAAPLADVGAKTAQTGSALDPSRLTSPDLAVRFATTTQNGRPLNIPKVVE